MKKPLLKTIIKTAALFVPRRVRKDWQSEWYAEIEANAIPKDATMAWAMGAFTDSLNMTSHFGFDPFLADIRFAFRSIRKAPGFSLVIIGTLALGIGLSSAIFSVVDGVVIRSLPYDDPQMLVRIWGENLEAGNTRSRTSEADFVDFKEQTTAFRSFGGYSIGRAILTGTSSDPTRISLGSASEGFFRTLGVTTSNGRDFFAEDFLERNAPVALISHSFWQSQTGGNEDAIGETLVLDGRTVEIIGVLPRQFDFNGLGVDVWKPIPVQPVDAAANQSVDGFGRDWLSISVIARIKDGTSIASAEADIRRVAANLEREYPNTNSGRSARLEPLHEAAIGDIAKPMYLLLGAVGVVLLIACVNVANLLIGRGFNRGREIAIRTAVGASGFQITRQFLTESVVLALAGGGLGIVAGHWILDGILLLSPEGIPRMEAVSLDARVTGIMAAVSVFAGVGFGIIPAIQAARTNVQDDLKDGGRTSGGAGKHRLRNGLVVIELALSTSLMAAGAVFLASLLNVLRVDPGFDPSGVVTMRLNMPMQQYNIDDNDAWAGTNAFFSELLDNVRALPDVAAASLSYTNPVEPDVGFPVGIQVVGQPDLPRNERPRANLQTISNGFFETFRIGLLRGRDFDSRDRKASPGAVIVNQQFVRKFLPNDDPLGQRIDNPPFWASAGYPTSSEIVGIVPDVRGAGLTADAPAAIYFPVTQAPMGNLRLIARADGDPTSIARSVQNAVWDLDPTLPVDELQTMEQAIGKTLAPIRFPVFLIGFFAVIAVALSALGVYGVVSSSVSERLHEFGIRRAVGASSKSIVFSVLRHGMGATATGIVIGAVGAWALNTALAGMLFQVDPASPHLMALVAVILLSVGGLASIVPGIRAVSVDPSIVLRDE